MKILIKSILIGIIIGLMTWKRDPYYPFILFLLFLPLILTKSKLSLLKNYIIFIPLAFGLSWFNALISYIRGEDPISIFIMVFMRIMALINFSAYFMLTIEPYELAENLSKIVPSSIAYVFYISYSMFLKALKHYQEFYDAMRARYLIKSRLDNIKLFIPAVISTINYVYRNSDALSISMEVRGFSDKRVFWRSSKITRKELGELLLISIIAIAGFFII